MSPKKKLDRYGDPLPSSATARLGSLRLRHGKFTEGLAFCPDGRTLVTGGYDGYVVVWSLPDGAPRISFQASEREVRALVVMPAGDRVVTGDRQGVLRAFDLLDGREVFVVSSFCEEINSIAVARDGSFLLVADVNSVYVVDPATGEKKRRCQLIDDPDEYPGSESQDVGQVVLFPGDRWMLALEDQVPVMLEIDGSRRRRGPKSLHRTSAFAVSPDGKRVALLDDRKLKLWSGVTPGMARGGVKVIDVGLEPVAVAFSHEGDRFAWSGHVDGKQGVVCVAPVGKPEAACALEGAGAYWATEIKFSPGGAFLAASGRDATVRVWDLETGCLVTPEPAATGALHGVAFAPDGETVATTGEAGGVTFWDVASGARRGTAPGSEPAYGIVFGREGDRVSCTLLHGMAVYDTTEDPGERKIETSEGNDLGTLVDTPWGEWFGFGAGKKRLLLLDPFTGKEVATVRSGRRGGYRTAFAVAPDGASVAWAMDDGVIELRSLPEGKLLGEVPGHGDAAQSLDFHPDGRRLVSTDQETSVVVWDMTNSEERWRVALSAGWVYARPRFSPDGTHLAWLEATHTLVLCTLADGPATKVARSKRRGVKKRDTPSNNRVRIEIPAHFVYDFAFSLRGDRIATVASDGTGLIWNVEPCSTL